MRARLAFVSLGLIAVACGGSSASAPPDTSPTATAPAPVTAEAAPTSTAAPTTESPPVSEAPGPTEPPAALGPPAPDFTLALSNGEAFVLSAQSKPVYLVFWAEW